MTTRRVTDKNEQRVFRSDRFFASNGKWYFSTRESTKAMGPYDAKPLAEQALADYVASKTGQAPGGWGAPGATH